jgi:hypothetical protein
MSDDFLKGSKLSRLLAGRSRPVRRFDLEVVREGSPESLKLAVRTLSTEETLRAQSEATAWLLKVGWSREDLFGDAGNSAQNLETMVRILAVALVDPDNAEAPFAKDADELRRCFDADEIRACFDEYNAHVTERSPFRFLKSLAEAREVADALGKGLTLPTNLPRFDTTSLRLIISSLAERATQPTTPNSSGTSPPTGSPDGSSPNSTPSRPVMTVSDG